MKRAIDVNKDLYQETTTIGNKVYSTDDLFNRVKDKEVFKVPLCSIDFTQMPWGDIVNIYQFCEHYARCNDADMEYPVILAPHGGIINGFHRVCKAVINCDDYIDAVQLSEFPEPITVYDKE